MVNMAILLVCGVREDGRREGLAIEPMLEESTESCGELFHQLKERGLRGGRLVVSDARRGLVEDIERAFPGASWQHCRVHFMHNILVHVPSRDKTTFADLLKLVWQAPNKETRKRTKLILIFPNSESYVRLITLYLSAFIRRSQTVKLSYLRI